MVECYDTARQLLGAMEKSEIIVAQEPMKGKYDAAVMRARMLISNDNIAHKVLTLFGLKPSAEWAERMKTCICVWEGAGHDDDGSPIVIGLRRIRFLEGFYRALTLIYLGGKTATRRYQFLASMNLLDFFRIFEIVEYLYFDFALSTMPEEERGLPGYDSWPPNIGNIGRHGDCLEFLVVFEGYAAMSSGIQRPMTNTFNSSRPSYRLILHDDCLKDGIKKADGIALDHILHKLPNDVFLESRYERYTLH